VGQKTHPLGFRLVTVQKHRSTWFSSFNKYSELIEEDFKIRQFFEAKSQAAGISKIEINRNSLGDKIEVQLHTARPGILVGHSGTNLEESYKKLNKIISSERSLNIKVLELEKPDAEAELIGDFIVEQLEKRIAFRRAVRKAIKRAQSAGIEGIKIQVSGRLNGAEIARSEWIREGRVPLQTLRADIDYADKRADTIYGVIGVKVWLFKGEVL
jgi:small subunit ribosomal protein S3